MWFLNWNYIPGDFFYIMREESNMRQKRKSMHDKTICTYVQLGFGSPGFVTGNVFLFERLSELASRIAQVLIICNSFGGICVWEWEGQLFRILGFVGWGCRGSPSGCDR